MLRTQRTIAAFVPALAAAFSACAHRGGMHSPKFHDEQPFGSEAQFNPVSQILNEGFNNLVLYSTDLGVTRQPYGPSARNLRHALTHIGPAYRRYGWQRALSNELFPGTGIEGGQWLPNYQDHMLGSGMVSARLEAWFIARGVPAPVLMSYLTMTASHVLNEVVEQPSPYSVDAISDLVIFDNLGFLLFRSERVRRAFSGPVTLTSWAWQPVFTAPTGSIENTGQSFVLRFPLPRRLDGWRGFYFYGVNHVLGLSRDLGGGRSLSGGLGAGSNVVIVADSIYDTRSVTLGFRLGLFYDKDNSLLASFLWENSRGTLATVNVYPGLMRMGAWSPGLWLAIRERGGLRFGVTAPLGIGVGYGHGQVK